jgi:hypothetical protein
MNIRSSIIDTLGLTPSFMGIKKVPKEFGLSAFFLPFLSVWHSSAFYLCIFLAFNLLNLLSSIIFDKRIALRKKITTFGADLFYVGVLATVVDILLNRIKIPFIDTHSFYISFIATLMTLNYIILISQRVYHLTSISKAKTAKNILQAVKNGVEDFKNMQQEDARKK